MVICFHSSSLCSVSTCCAIWVWDWQFGSYFSLTSLTNRWHIHSVQVIYFAVRLLSWSIFSSAIVILSHIIINFFAMYCSVSTPLWRREQRSHLPECRYSHSRCQKSSSISNNKFMMKEWELTIPITQFLPYIELLWYWWAQGKLDAKLSIILHVLCFVTMTKLKHTHFYRYLSLMISSYARTSCSHLRPYQEQVHLQPPRSVCQLWRLVLSFSKRTMQKKCKRWVAKSKRHGKREHNTSSLTLLKA